MAHCSGAVLFISGSSFLPSSFTLSLLGAHKHLLLIVATFTPSAPKADVSTAWAMTYIPGDLQRFYLPKNLPFLLAPSGSCTSITCKKLHQRKRFKKIFIFFTGESTEIRKERNLMNLPLFFLIFLCCKGEIPPTSLLALNSVSSVSVLEKALRCQRVVQLQLPSPDCTVTSCHGE